MIADVRIDEALIDETPMDEALVVHMTGKTKHALIGMTSGVERAPHSVHKGMPKSLRFRSAVALVVMSIG